MTEPSTGPGATPGSGFEFNRPTIVAIAMAAGAVTGGPLGIVGVILAYVWRGDTHQPWEATHYTYMIRTFWIGVVAAILGIVTLLIGIGALILLALVGWTLVRSVMSLMNAQKRLPMDDPETFLF